MPLQLEFFVWSSLARLPQRRVDHSSQISHGPKGPTQAGCHRRAEALKCLVLLHVVVPDRVQRDHMHVVLEFRKRTHW